MGLDVSHGAWQGAYSAFHRLRVHIIERLGGSIESEGHRFYWNLPDKYMHPYFRGLHTFLNHSDCDGEIEAIECFYVARSLLNIAHKLKGAGLAEGHINRNGGYEACAVRFAKGCLEAYLNREPLEFH